MIPNTFAYVRANSLEEAIRLLAESQGGGKLLAGGHSLVPLMKFRLTAPATLIDISQLSQLRGIVVENDRLVIGALTTHREIAIHPLVRQHVPVLAEAARQIGDLQVRNRGTIGGNLAHADPAADLPGVALALDALLEIAGEDGEETLAAEHFFLGPLVTALPDTSVLTRISFELPPSHTRSTYLKFAHHASGYAVVGVCAIAGIGADGLIDYVRVGINGVADVAYRAYAVEQQLLGHAPTAEVIRQAAAYAADDGEISHDLFASEEYRRHLVKVYTERALRRVLLAP